MQDEGRSGAQNEMYANLSIGTIFNAVCFYSGSAHNWRDAETRWDGWDVSDLDCDQCAE